MATFWVTYATRKDFAFDMILWKKIDQRFFGPCTVPQENRWEKRVELLSDEERQCMEEVVSRQLKYMETRTLAWEPREVYSGV